MVQMEEGMPLVLLQVVGGQKYGLTLSVRLVADIGTSSRFTMLDPQAKTVD